MLKVRHDHFLDTLSGLSQVKGLLADLTLGESKKLTHWAEPEHFKQLLSVHCRDLTKTGHSDQYQFSRF